MDETITYVRLDAHKKTISVAVAEPARAGAVRSLGSIANQPATGAGKDFLMSWGGAALQRPDHARTVRAGQTQRPDEVAEDPLL
jgi:hypothetical protein